MRSLNPTALLILYNPYYESSVIQSHLEILKSHGSVAFGKIKSKMRAQEPKAQAEPSAPAQILEHLAPPLPAPSGSSLSLALLGRVLYSSF